SCHTDRCPTGIATQNQRRQDALIVPDKATRVHQFHENTLMALRELMAAAGLHHPDELGPEHIIRRVSSTEVRSLAVLHRFMHPGELLAGEIPEHPAYKVFWEEARADSFIPPPQVRALRGTKVM